MTKEENEVVVEKSKKELYDELKAKRQAEKEKQLKKQAKKEKGYRNPINSLAGKIIIWILALSMVATIIFSFVYLFIEIISKA